MLKFKSKIKKCCNIKKLTAEKCIKLFIFVLWVSVKRKNNNNNNWIYLYFSQSIYIYIIYLCMRLDSSLYGIPIVWFSFDAYKGMWKIFY